MAKQFPIMVLRPPAFLHFYGKQILDRLKKENMLGNYYKRLLNWPMVFKQIKKKKNMLENYFKKLLKWPIIFKQISFEIKYFFLFGDVNIKLYDI